MKFFSLTSVLILLIVVSFVYTSAGKALGDDKSHEELVVLTGKEDGKYFAGEDINISIIVKSNNEWQVDLPTLRYQVIYDSLNMPVVKGVVAREIQPYYTYHSSRRLPDYAPPGRYRLVIDLISTEGVVLGSASSELTIEANYAGIAKAIGIFVLYSSAVLILFWLILLRKL